MTAFFCFMFSWVELLLARTLTSVNAKPIAATMTRTVIAAGMDWGVLSAAGVVTIVPGALVIWFVRNYIARALRWAGCSPMARDFLNQDTYFSSPGIACGERSDCAVPRLDWRPKPMENIAWMAWTPPTAIFFVLLAMTLAVMTWLAAAYPEAERVGGLRIPTTRGDRLFISLIMAAVIHLLWVGFVGTDPIATLPVGEGS